MGGRDVHVLVHVSRPVSREGREGSEGSVRVGQVDGEGGGW